MKRFKNILCVVTPEETCRPALARAVSLAVSNQAELTVAVVMPQLSSGIGMPDGGPISVDLQTKMKADRLQALKSLTETYRQKIHTEHEILTGVGFLEIIRAVLRNGHDLLIKPAENPHFMERLFGSEDMHLLRKCPCPVWLTKPEEKPNYGCILAAVDFDPENRTRTCPSISILWNCRAHWRCPISPPCT
jgi:universal stress protein E